MGKNNRAIWSLPPVLLLTALLLLHAAETSSAALSAMQLSATVVIPTLFPFCVLSSFLVLTGLAARWGRLLRRPMESLFHVDGGCAAAWILGTLCGYPVGAAILARLYEGKIVSKQSAEHALSFCSNAGPGFIVTIAGATMIGSAHAGWLLLAVHIIASILAGLTLRPKNKPSDSKVHLPAAGSYITAFTESVRSAALTMVQISGFIVLFSVLLCLLQITGGLLRWKQGTLLILSGFLELTNGIRAIGDFPASAGARFILAAAMLGWSGFCVHCQILSLTLPLGLSCKPYLCGKLLQSLYSLLLSIPLSRLLSEEISAVSGIQPRTSFGSFFFLAAWALGSALLFFFFLWKFGATFGIIMSTE